MLWPFKDLPEISVPSRTLPAAIPKQTINGLEQRTLVSTTKWAVSLRHVSKDKTDPYGKPTMSVVENDREIKQTKAAERMLNRVISKYSLDDKKVLDTINSFRHHVLKPTMDDLSQLDEVLAAHVHRTQQKAKRSRQLQASMLAASRSCRQPGRGSRGVSAGAEHDRGGSGTERSSRPVVKSADSHRSALYLDVRKDEWYAVNLDQAAKAEQEERQKAEEKKRESANAYATLRLQQQQLDELWEKDLELQRQEARKQKAIQKLWRDKEKARKADLEIWRKMEKKRAEKAKEDFMNAYRAVVAKEQEGENIEVRKIKALIFQDKKNAEAKVAKARAEVDAVKRFNDEEAERKKNALKLQLENDERELRTYQELLKARELAREEEERKRQERLKAQEKVAQARHDKAAEEGAEDERRANEVQRLRQAKLDRETAAREERRAKGLKDTLAYVMKQQQDHQLHDQQMCQQNMREAKLAARDYEIACKVDESKRQSARDRNLMYREDLKRQIVADEQYVKDGCGERGMTKFEMQYNSAAIAASRCRRDEKRRSMDRSCSTRGECVE